jgi:regulatory protein
MRKPQQAPPDPLTAGLHLLARRSYSVAGLRRALEKKYGAAKEVTHAIARLRELGYLNDAKYAAQAASSLVRNRAFGSYRIRRELKARLVDYKQIEPALHQAFEETTEREVLAKVLEKKVRTLKLPLTLARLHSLCQSLMRRGFRSDDIMKAVRARPELRSVAEDLDGGEF